MVKLLLGLSGLLLLGLAEGLSLLGGCRLYPLSLVTDLSLELRDRGLKRVPVVLNGLLELRALQPD